MRTSFWKALERLGAAGSAALSWRHLLGDEWNDASQLLVPTGRSARSVLHPLRPEIRLDLMPDGEDGFVAVCDDMEIPPVPVAAADADELFPCWHALSRALADTIGFTAGAWESAGWLRRIGTSQNAAGLVSPVLLFLPPGGITDSHILFEELAARPRSLVLLPSGRWMSPALDSLRTGIGHEFVAITERLPTRATPAALPVIASGRREPPAAKAVIRPAAGMAWKDITVTILTGRTLRITAPGQQKEHTFRGKSKIDRHHPLGILMEMAALREWSNPPKSDSAYERTVKAFGRMRKTMHDLIPLPGDAFVRTGGAWQPTFTLDLSASLAGGRQQIAPVTKGRRK
jgi:hypothetical protein